MTARTLPYEQPLRWLKCSIGIAEQHYTLFLLCGLFSFFSAGAVSSIPHIGSIGSSILMFVYFLATLRLTDKLLNTKETLKFETFLNLAFDPIVYNKFRPYLIVIFAAALVKTVLLAVGPGTLSLPLSFLVFLLIILSSFAAFADLNSDHIDPAGRIKEIAYGFFINGKLTFMITLYLLLFGFLSLLCFAVPFFFYFLPMTGPVYFLLYASIFDTMDIDEMQNHWSTPA